MWTTGLNLGIPLSSNLALYIPIDTDVKCSSIDFEKFDM